jgi:two-component system cell cycle sensor histidine kinase/response regulator CckA
MAAWRLRRRSHVTDRRDETGVPVSGELDVSPAELFDAHPVAMAIWDPASGAILAANDAAVRQYGYDRSEIQRLTVDRLVHPEDLPRLMDLVPSLPEGVGPTQQFRNLRRDGTVIEVEMSGHPIVFRGRLARLILASDVTERRGLEEQLRQAQKMEAVGRLAGGIAHDFNNLLMAIMGFSELLLEQLPADSEERDAADQIHRAGKRAAALTSQLLAFSRPRPDRPETIDLNELVNGLAPTLGELLGRGIQVTVDTLASRSHVFADRAQLEQVLVSCAVNARDAMPDGGRLTIQTSDIDEVATRALGGVVDGAAHVLLTVADTGVGMEADTRDRAFDPFFTTKPAGGTTGLGLALAYAAVRQADGRIRLESSPGHGSTVRIFLPLVDQPTSSNVDVPRPSVRGQAGGGATILLAEDEPAVLALVERVLTQAGHTVLAASDGIAAIDLAARNTGRIDLLLTDIVMPGPNGIETARRIRLGRPDLRVLYMSGWATEALVREGLHEDDIRMLAKPFSIADLLEAVGNALREEAATS